MIGGVDVIIPNPGFSPSEARELVLKVIQRQWKNAIVQNAEDGHVFDSCQSIPFARVKQLFVFKNKKAFQSWERLGADPSNANTMVHLAGGDESITLVVDDRNETTMRSVIAEAQQLLRIVPGVPIDWRRAA